MTGPTPRTMRWRPLAPFLLGTGAALVLAAVVLRDPTALFLALPLFLAPVAAGLTGPRRDPTAEVRVAVEGAAADVQLRGTVRVGPEVRPHDLVVELRRPAGLLGDRPPELEYAPSEIRFRADWKAAAPVITVLEAPAVRWRDPLGLIERDAVTSAGPLPISRYPPELLRIGSVRLEHTTLLPGETRSRRVGEGGEFHGIRPARPGDAPRQINWRATARAGTLLANEYDLDKTGDLLIVLDARPTPLGPMVDERLLSISRAAAIGLSEAFLRVKSRVGLGIFGEFLDVVPLSTGRTQRIRLEAALGRARLSSVVAPAERCAVSVRRQFPPGLTTVVFTALADDASDDLSPYLRRRGYPVIVLSPSPLPIVADASRLRPEDEALARRLAQLVRRDRIARAWADAPVIDWDDYWSLGKFVDFVRRPRIRGVG